MKFVVLLIFTSFGFVLSAQKTSKNPTTVTLYASEIVSEEQSENIGHKISKKSIGDQPSAVENSENHYDEAIKEPCRLSLPYLEGLSAADILQDPYDDDKLQDFVLPMDVMPPTLPSLDYSIPFNKWTPYDLDYLTREPVQDYRSSYNSYNIPSIFPSPVSRVRSLPPVISTHIHETIPDVDEGYALDGSDNEILLPPYVRSVRSRDDDFFAQLQKDAIIPNLLPTMPFPYMRSSGPVYQHGQGGPIVAMFPAGSGNDCALPFLVSCTPKVSRGTLTQNAYGQIPMNLAPSTVVKTKHL